MPTATVTPIRPIRVYPGAIGVHVRTGVTYRVISAGTKNYRAATIDGTEYNIPIPGLRPASLEEVEAHTAQEPPPVFFYAGNVVRFKANPKAPAGFYVVTKETTTGYNLSPLGGDLTGKYYRSVPAVKIEKVSVSVVGSDGFTNV